MALHLLKDGGSTAAATDGFESVQQLQKGIDVFREAVEG
jgi:hypothetical protein